MGHGGPNLVNLVFLGTNAVLGQGGREVGLVLRRSTWFLYKMLLKLLF